MTSRVDAGLGIVRGLNVAVGYSGNPCRKVWAKTTVTHEGAKSTAIWEIPAHGLPSCGGFIPVPKSPLSRSGGSGNDHTHGSDVQHSRVSGL